MVSSVIDTLPPVPGLPAASVYDPSSTWIVANPLKLFSAVKVAV
jgi:hypothetical protein